MPRQSIQQCWKIPLLNGLYKVEYGVNDAFGRSIMCMHDGKMLGGNSAFAHLGTYQEKGEEILAEIITQRHNEDPHYKPLMDTDVAAISVRGRVKGNMLRFEGSAAPRPGALFWANLMRLDDGVVRSVLRLEGDAASTEEGHIDMADGDGDFGLIDDAELEMRFHTRGDCRDARQIGAGGDRDVRRRDVRGRLRQLIAGSAGGSDEENGKGDGVAHV